MQYSIGEFSRITRTTIKALRIYHDQLIVGYRMTGRYDEIGKGFSILGRHAGRHISGPPGCLYYDDSYKEQDADFEPFFCISKPVEKPSLNCRKLKGGLALTLIHKGPYEELTRSYKLLMDAIKERGLEQLPLSREIYLKGPGMILKGNPKNYLTEIQFLVKAQ